MGIRSKRRWIGICDGCSAKAWRPVESRGEAKRDAINVGYQWVKGRLLCPDCQKKEA